MLPTQITRDHRFHSDTMSTFYIILSLILVFGEASKTSKQSEDDVINRINDNFGSRIPRYSSYNGHPLFSYGKKPVSYHNTPAVMTYDAGVGDYEPSYTSVGGYANQDDDVIKPKNCPEEDNPPDNPVENGGTSSEDEVGYTTHKPKEENYENYKSEDDVRHDVLDEKPEEDDVKPYKHKFVYNVHTEHVIPQPAKVVYSHPQTSYGWSYEITSRHPQKPMTSYENHVASSYRGYGKPMSSGSYYRKKPSAKPHYDASHTSRHQHLISSYSVHVYVPESYFDCRHHYHPGFYADVQTDCKFWHYCHPDGRHDVFKCPQSTSFNQQTLTCDWSYNVNCHSSPRYYHLNRFLNIRHKTRQPRNLNP